MDYTAIILNGITDSVKKYFFSDHLKREFKNAELSGYSKNEFYSGCMNVCNKLKYELDKSRYNLANSVIFENEKDLLNQLSRITVNLHTFTRNEFTGFLYENEIRHIESCIIEMMKLDDKFIDYKPIFEESIIDDLFLKLQSYFQPADQFKEILKGNNIFSKINFYGNQMQLAGLFIGLKSTDWIKLGSHEQTYRWIKNNFLIKGKEIETEMILRYLNGKTKINEQSLIDIRI